ncbi:MAG: hypothetical protein V1888_02320 [archaeon]
MTKGAFGDSPIWNRGIKLLWNQLWVRKDEFHSSLNMDVNAVKVMLGMNKKQRDAYIKDLCKRRQIAHERDIASNRPNPA